MNCKTCLRSLPELLLSPAASANLAAREHLDHCTACAEEFHALKATFDLLDSWQAPEPSAYFDQKLAVRLREEQAASPAGWWERMRSRLMFNTGRQFRPALVGALALALIVSGGTAIDLSIHHSASPAPTSATVKDLQILDNNTQAWQTIDQMLDDSSSDDAAPAAQPVT